MHACARPGTRHVSFQNCDWIRGSEAPVREVCSQLAARRSSPPEARLESSADSVNRLAAVAERRSCYAQPGKGRIDQTSSDCCRIGSKWKLRGRGHSSLPMRRPHAPVGAAERARTATSVAILETSRFLTGPDLQLIILTYSPAKVKQGDTTLTQAMRVRGRSGVNETSSTSRITNRNRRLFCQWDAVVSALEVERHVDQADHRRHFN